MGIHNPRQQLSRDSSRSSTWIWQRTTKEDREVGSGDLEELINAIRRMEDMYKPLFNFDGFCSREGLKRRLSELCDLESLRALARHMGRGEKYAEEIGRWKDSDGRDAFA